MSEAPRPPRISIVAGGTGGHLYPGIAVAQALWKMPEMTTGLRPQIRFVVRRGDLGREILRREGFDVVEIAGQGFPRRLGAAAFQFPLAFYRSWRQASDLLTRERPDFVLGMGGYLSFPVLTMAALRGIPTLIHEQNAVPGVANRLLGRWVRSVAVSFSGTETFFPAKKVWVSGLPVRLTLKASEAGAARDALGLRRDLPTFFAFGGSLGAHRLNEVLLEVWKALHAAGQAFQVLHVTGTRDYEAFAAPFTAAGIPGKMLPYCHDMPNAYAAADLVFCRSGASTIAELAAAGRPAFLVPYPYATNDHQWFNAQVLVGRGLAEACRERDVSIPSLTQRLTDWLSSPQTLADWRQRCEAAALAQSNQPSAAVTIAQHIRKATAV